MTTTHLGISRQLIEVVLVSDDYFASFWFTGTFPHIGLHRIREKEKTSNEQQFYLLLKCDRFLHSFDTDHKKIPKNCFLINMSSVKCP